MRQLCLDRLHVLILKYLARSPQINFHGLQLGRENSCSAQCYVRMCEQCHCRECTGRCCYHHLYGLLCVGTNIYTSNHLLDSSLFEIDLVVDVIS